MISLTWPRALAWRMRRQMLDPIGKWPVEAVVSRLGAIQAQSGLGAELSINARRAGAEPEDVSAALEDGRLIKTFAFRGGTYLMTPEDAGIYLALRAASRMWELPSWQSYYGLKPVDWPHFRAAIREALADGPLTRKDLGAAVTATAQFRHLRFAFEGDNWTLLKPLAWQGDMSFSPSVGGRTAFQRLDANPRWAGVPELEEAGPRAVEAYFAAYGPATSAHVRYWLGEGLGAGRKRIDGWLAGLGKRLTEVVVDGTPALVRSEDLADLLATSETATLRLLPGHDQWVMGPGTADAHVTPPALRPQVGRGANVVIVSGVVSGTWSIHDDRVALTWLAGSRIPRANVLGDEIQRLAQTLGHDLQPAD